MLSIGGGGGGGLISVSRVQESVCNSHNSRVDGVFHE